MRIFLLLLIAIFIAGCSNNNSSSVDNPPVSPTHKEAKKSPPSVPKI